MYKDRFCEYLKLERNYSEKTIDAYRRDLVIFERFLKETDSQLDLLNVDRDLVRLWVVDLMDKSFYHARIDLVQLLYLLYHPFSLFVHLVDVVHL